MLSMLFIPTETIEDVLVSAPNGTECGHILLMDDGYYQFWPDARPGYWPSWSMRQIADKVDAMNHEWDKLLQAELGRLS